MLIESILTALLLGGTAAVVIGVVVLPLAEVVSWFRERSALVDNDADHVAFTVAEALRTGMHETVSGVFGPAKVIQGVMNMRTNTVVDHREISVSEDLDKDLAERHSRQKVVIYD